MAAFSPASLGHLAAAGFFAVFAVLWSYPLVLNLPTHIPGDAPGDNVAFLWSFWWMREAVGSGLDPFRTPLLFAPSGTDLSLNTHLTLPALAGATVLGGFPLVVAFNLTLLATIALNGFCAYWLAWRLTGDRVAALIAGVVFAGSPYLAARLHGHFNLATAWTLPLFALAVPGTVRGSMKAAVAAGLILGATAYIDYYYVIYLLAFAAFAAALIGLRWSVAFRGATPRNRVVVRIVWALLAIDVIVLAAIGVTGGFTATIGTIRISAQDPFNALQAFWLLLAGLVWLQTRPRIGVALAEGWAARRGAAALLVMIAVLGAAAAPLLWHLAGLLLGGEYVSQQYFWRSAPKGIDVATLFLGNPFHGLWGDWVRSHYGRFGIDVMEASGWLAVAPLALAGWAVWRLWHKAATRYWTAMGALFFVWALGPHLMALGINTGMILPQTALRFVPVAANARIPGRAMILVSLAVAMLGALALARWRARSRPGLLAMAGIGFIVVADDVPAPFALVALDRPGIYETLRDRPERGIVYELPLGTRDSFHQRGLLDHRVLFYQTIHRRPIVGGVVSRLSPAVRAGYEADPLVSALLQLSEGGAVPRDALPDRAEAGDLLTRQGAAFVMLNRGTAAPALVDYVEGELPLTLIAAEGERTLFAVAPR